MERMYFIWAVLLKMPHWSNGFLILDLTFIGNFLWNFIVISQL